MQPNTIGVTRAHQCPLLNGLFVNAAPAVPRVEDDAAAQLRPNISAGGELLGCHAETRHAEECRTSGPEGSREVRADEADHDAHNDAEEMFLSRPHLFSLANQEVFHL